MQILLEVVGRRGAARCPQGYRQTGYDARQGRANTGLQHAYPNEYNEREGDIGRDREGPATQRLFIVPVASEVDERRAGHTAQRGNHRQCGFEAFDSSPSMISRLTS